MTSPPPDALDEAPAPADIMFDSDPPACSGAWTLEGCTDLERRLARRRPPAGDLILNGGAIQALDTTGALLLLNRLADLRQGGRQVQLLNLRPEYQALLELVAERRQAAQVPHTAGRRSLNPVAALGRAVWLKLLHASGLLAFLGETTVVLLKTLLQPRRLRWQAILANLQHAGLEAVPIVGLLAFLIGVVIAYQGGNQLRYYGANIFIVDLVALIMVRELAPLLAAIIAAGRTGSAFTAQIGTMQITEEVDALRTIGINPFEMLVLPKLFSLCLALPLLALFADAASLFGGMVVAATLLEVDFATFLQRLPQVVTPFSFLFGIGKTLVFALVIALVGCYQGFQVRGGADSVGRQTTESVVQAIFLVIVVDAIFAVLLGTKGIRR